TQASAVEAWEFGKKLGVSFDGEEMEIINGLIMMEERELNKGAKYRSAKDARKISFDVAGAVSTKQD
ncbi:hypothetical protein Ancab_031465, partial [Ancistrocladus abbreviatus]